jgi:quinol-cytochrome oxidoreductase complex cytochrome b subunit
MFITLMIMRNVNSGWLIRYLHSNGAGFFFIFVYIHIAKALYYGSYRAPRVLLWSIGVVIFLVMIITAFLGITETCLKWLNMISLHRITMHLVEKCRLNLDFR